MIKKILGLTAPLLILAILSQGGCSLFKGHAEEKPAAEDAVFDKQRSEQEKMSDYVASAGRENPKEKKEASRGQTFLLSDKAREIYNNTER